MKKVMAVTAGVLVAFAPAGTAFAGEPGGNAWGNCKHNASGGKVVLGGSTLESVSGLGGFSKTQACEVVVETSTSPTEPAPPAAPPMVYG